jgi:DNA primase large subunit
MRRLHARYPFLQASREAVQDAEVDLGQLVTDGGAAVERGHERVERALLAGTVASEHRASTHAELLSYPVARVLISLLDTPGAVEKYANAEAALAHRRFTEDFDDDAQLKSTDRERLSLNRLLTDFELSGSVRPTGEGEFLIGVTAYLKLASGLDGDRWRLVARELHDGVVPVRRPELYTLLREAVRRRVADDLPLSVPEPVADALGPQLRALKDAVADVELRATPSVVAPELFPPCIKSLLNQAPALDPRGRFALVAFLSGLDVDSDAVLSFYGGEPEQQNSPSTEPVAAEINSDTPPLKYQFDRLADDRGSAFPPPACATMQAFDLCVNRDELCSDIGHPVTYYAERVDNETSDTDDLTSSPS